jgi:hypothetical protein
LPRQHKKTKTHRRGCVYFIRCFAHSFAGGGGGGGGSRWRSEVDPLYIEDPLNCENNVGQSVFRIFQVSNVNVCAAS